MLALPHLTGAELARALERLGYRTHTRSSGLATMCRRANAVVVPETATLGPALVAAILRSAEVDPLELLDVLAAADDVTEIDGGDDLVLPASDRVRRRRGLSGSAKEAAVA